VEKGLSNFDRYLVSWDRLPARIIEKLVELEPEAPHEG
jgi:hypothetical protein